MNNIAFIIAYDGTRYLGWQKTKEGPSIEEELSRVLETILQHPIALQAASRTDRGVHADQQVVNILTQKDFDLNRLRHSMNCLLPDDIRVMEVSFKKPFFHPTLDAIGKEYHYRIYTGPVAPPLLRFTSWHYPFPINRDRMKKAIPLFLGKRDFASLRNHKKDLSKNMKEDDTIRELFDIQIEDSHEHLIIKMVGDNFLYKMARNIAGTLVYVGAGKILPQEVEAILSGKDRTKAGVTAPAHGLTLHKVYYDAFWQAPPHQTQLQNRQ